MIYDHLNSRFLIDEGEAELVLSFIENDLGSYVSDEEEMMESTMDVEVRGTLEHNKSEKIGKTHYTSIYFAKKEKIKTDHVVRGRVVTTDDVVAFRLKAAACRHCQLVSESV